MIEASVQFARPFDQRKKSSLPPTMALTVDTVTLEAGDEPVNEVERELLE